MTKQPLDHLLSITAALADANRVRILLCLQNCAASGGCACSGDPQGCPDACLCQITELLELAGSTVSKHLSILKQAGLVEARKEGRWMYYSIIDPAQATPLASAALEWVRASLSDDPRRIADAARLKEILQEDPGELCKRQGQRRACCSSAPATRAAARWPKAGPANSKPTSLKHTPPASSQKE